MIRQFHHSDFYPVEPVLERKRERGITISLVLPALNEASTIGSIISKSKRDLIDNAPFLDEIVVMNGRSTDETSRIALDAGAVVFDVEKICEDERAPEGKGASLWKSLFVTKGDIVVCIDADITNFHSRFIYGLAAPLILEPDISFVKAWYKRPLVHNGRVAEDSGGRVTEILVRPMLSAFYPELAMLFQPLAGEYAFRRGLIEGIPFSSGYGVEIGMILEIYKMMGISCFAQVDMGIRYHRNRDIKDLGKMAFGIVQTIFRCLQKENRLSLAEDLNTVMISPYREQLEKTDILEIELPSLKKCRSCVL